MSVVTWPVCCGSVLNTIMHTVCQLLLHTAQCQSTDTAFTPGDEHSPVVRSVGALDSSHCLHIGHDKRSRPKPAGNFRQHRGSRVIPPAAR